MKIASSNDEQQKIFSQILNLISQRQKDIDKREIGLECLRKIYAYGHTDIINNLWKECKNSFEIQPYNIIDVRELSLKKELGSGTFGCVKSGLWKNNGKMLPVAVKVIQDNSQAFDLSDLRGEV